MPIEYEREGCLYRGSSAYSVFLRALDARNLRILCMVFHDCQIMSGTQKLSQKDTPEPFNRVLVAFFDP